MILTEIICKSYPRKFGIRLNLEDDPDNGNGDSDSDDDQRPDPPETAL